MSTLQQAFKNEYTKRFVRVTRVRPPQKLPRSGTPHYRMPKVEGGSQRWHVELGVYRGPEIPLDRERREVPHDRDVAAVHRRQVRPSSAAANEAELAGIVPVGIASGQQQPGQP